MKTYLFLAGVLLILGAQRSLADNESSLLKWRVLSARTQNLYSELQLIPKDGAADPSIYEEQLKKVGDALDELVAAKELVSKRVTIQSPADAEQKELKAVADVIQLIGQEYGIFVASEMCDLGARLRFMIMMPDKPLDLHLRLPAQDLKTFMDVAEPFLIEDKKK